MPYGSERPIAHASKTLNDHQKQYSHLEREGLAVIFGLTKFNQFLYGREFGILVDNKALISLFSSNKDFPVLAFQRIHRWSLLLNAYRYTIQYRPTEKHTNADALSRRPKGPDYEFDKKLSDGVNVIDLIEIPLNRDILRFETRKDTCLREFLCFLEKGWPCIKKDSFMFWFYKNRNSISVEDGLLVLNLGFPRILIPKSMQKEVLKVLHTAHWGVVKTKQLARRYCVWRVIEKDIESMIRSCVPCSKNARLPNKQFYHWPEPSNPFERVHVYFAGPFKNHMWFILVDSFSRFPFVLKRNGFSKYRTIMALKSICTLEGIPKTIVSDNGPQFSFTEF
ncbi:Transposon Tf2-11 polyprotein [Thelohanellus kitauei]|uniref:Transposon Tf2-11 polyprotein n=1 Tax=Thelohanellus kitauei TaxID=669202 RepID=A0A0C2N8J0_THEKT|nr:Transposon Tf2-11 polyprotein [Thelohanellus kitauei]